nr:2-hydroxychromene-2-carboxylate isomerase [Variovorax boronicumulans]
MPTPTVQFLFDFGSPNAYLCHRVIPAIEARTGVPFVYQPILLGGLFKLANNRSPAEAFADIPNKRAYDRLEIDRFVARHGLANYRFNPFFPINTLQLMRGAVAAQKLGCFAPYVEAVYVAMWERGLDMGQAAVVTATLEEAGLPAAQLLATAQEADMKARLLANTNEAHARGAFGSPSFLVGDELFFGKDRLREVEEEIVRQRG